MRAQRYKLAALCLATFMLLLDITIVQAALPAIQRKLGADLTGLQWTVDAYTLPLAALIITLGTIADRFGRRWVFLAGVAVFTTASLACGMATSLVMLDVFRAVQGIGGAAMFATTLALIGQEFTGPARGRAVLVWGSTVGAAVACGPVLGGALAQYASWRWIFLVNVPAGFVTAAMTMAFIRDGRDDSGRRLDLAGLGTMTVGLTLFVGGLLRGSASNWANAWAIVALVSGVAMLALFGWLQQRPGAMIDRELWRNRSFTGVSVATLTLGAGMFAAILYLTIYLQNALGISPFQGGLRLLPLTVPIVVVPLLLRRAGIAVVSGRLLAIGLATIAAGMLALLWTSADGSWLRALPGLVAAGVGISLANAAVAATALAVVAPNRTGLASGVSNTCRLGGIAIGIAALGAVFRTGISLDLPAGTPRADAITNAIAGGQLTRAAHELPNGLAAAQVAFTDGLHVVFVVCAVLLAIGSVAAHRFVRVGPPRALATAERSRMATGQPAPTVAGSPS